MTESSSPFPECRAGRTLTVSMRVACVALAVCAGAASVAKAVAVHAQQPPDIDCIAGDSLPETDWFDHVAIPSGQVKWAGWGDLRIRIERPDRGIRMVVHTTGSGPALPEEGKHPMQPVWLEERVVLDEAKRWARIGPASMQCASLEQGDQVLLLGIHEDPEKRGGAILYWRFGARTQVEREIFKPWSLGDAEIVLKRWGADLEPEVVPVVKKKSKLHWLVARKGKRIVAVLRFQSAGTGGDPYDRWFASMAPGELEKAKGDVTFVAEVPSKKVEKFERDHEPEQWDPANVSPELRVDGHHFLVRIAKDSELGDVYRIYTKPAE